MELGPKGPDFSFMIMSRARLIGLLARLFRYVVKGDGSDRGVAVAVREAFVWNMLNLLVTQVLGLAIFVLLSYRLSPAIFGVFGLALLLIDLFSQQLKAAAQDAIVQRNSFTPATLSTAFFCLLPVCALVPLAAWGLSGPISILLKNQNLKEILPVLALSVLFVPAQAVCEAMIARVFGFRTIALRNMGAVLIGGAAGIWTAFSPAAEWALVAQRLGQGAFAMAFLMYTTRWRPRALFDGQTAGQYAMAALQLWAAQVTAVAASRLGEGIVGIKLGAASLGLMRVGGRFVETLHGTVTSPISNLWVPGLARVGDDAPERRKFVLDLLALSAFFSVPAFSGLALVGRDFADAVLSKEYAATGLVITLLAVMQIWTPLGYFRDGVLAGLRRNQTRLWLSLLDCLLTVLVTLYAVRFGLVGVLWSCVILGGVLTTIVVIVLSGVLGMPIRSYLGAAAPAYIAAAGMAMAVLGLQALTPDMMPLLRLICGAGLGACVYLGILVLAFRPWLTRAWITLRGRPEA